MPVLACCEQGARLTGAGWGGCVVACVEDQKRDAFMSAVRDRFYGGVKRLDVAGRCVRVRRDGLELRFGARSPLLHAVARISAHSPSCSPPCSDLERMDALLFATKPATGAAVFFSDPQVCRSSS